MFHDKNKFEIQGIRDRGIIKALDYRLDLVKATYGDHMELY